MKLPTDLTARHGLYRNLIRMCEVSREDRRARHQRLRTWFLNGSDSGRAKYNKLAEHVQASASYLYAPSSVRFGVVLPPDHGDEWIEEEEAAREEMHRLWHDTGAALTFGLGVTWAHVWDSAIFKVFTDQNEPTVRLISDPGDVGVLREDLDDLSQQEAICHWYVMDLSAFRRWIANHRDAEGIWTEAEQHAGPGEDAGSEALPPTVQRIILAQATPSMVGVARASEATDLGRARSREPVVKLAELWVRDDALKGDYRVVTNLLATERIIWDPPNPLIPDEHPFHGLALDPLPGYVWGISPIQGLLDLQAWREEKLDALNLRENLQLDPPLFFEGMAGITDEKARAFRKPGGQLASAMPGAKVSPIVPAPLPDPFAMIDQIDRMFANRAGLPMGLRGQTEPGVRSGEHAIMQAMLGAGPTLTRAMLVEATLEGIATAMLRLRRRMSGTPLRTLGESREFMLSQMPGDFVVRVTAHSASPVYQQQILQKAVLAKQHQAIDNETFLELLDLPMAEILKAKARRLGKAQAEKAERLLAIQEKKAEKAQKK